MLDTEGSHRQLNKMKKMQKCLHPLINEVVCTDQCIQNCPRSHLKKEFLCLK